MEYGRPGAKGNIDYKKSLPSSGSYTEKRKPYRNGHTGTGDNASFHSFFGRFSLSCFQFWDNDSLVRKEITCGLTITELTGKGGSCSVPRVS